MLKKWLNFLIAVILRFSFGFILIVLPLIFLVAIIALDGHYLESATFVHGRPTSRAFYETFIKSGDYKALALCIGLMGSLGGIFSAVVLSLKDLPWKKAPEASDSQNENLDD
jgi:hypothetical protein